MNTSMLDKRLVSDTNLSEETRARIEAIQRRMEEQGVTNVRFSWNYEKLLEDKPMLETVARTLCDVMEKDLSDYEEVVFDDTPDIPTDVQEIINNTTL